MRCNAHLLCSAGLCSPPVRIKDYKLAGLYYSLFDLTLNGGLGDVVTTEKNILLGKNGEVVDQKLTAVPGCSGVWLVTRLRNQNAYRSYEIGYGGLNTTPVVSVAGNFPLQYYGATNAAGGVMKAAVAGERLAVACATGSIHSKPTQKGGLELYDFESCSGTLSNAQVLDTVAYFGVCFSPDDSKLYATAFWERAVYQFDLSLGSLAAIKASKTKIFSNPNYGNQALGAPLLGDLKRGLDDKIYVSKNTCENGLGTEAMHEIAQPNLAGMACGPVLSSVSFPSASCAGLFLPADIVRAPKQDTVTTTTMLDACFEDSLKITAPPGSCYRWDDGTTGQSRTVYADGRYQVSYSDGNCKLHIDTYQVIFRALPVPGKQAYACPGTNTGKLLLTVTDDTEYIYEWYDGNMRLIKTHASNAGDTLDNMDTGTYHVTVRTAGGCIANLSLHVNPLPRPVAGFDVQEIVCYGEHQIITNTSDAPLSKWYFEYDSAIVRSPGHTFWGNGKETILQVVLNPEGCADSLSKTVLVERFKVRLTADEPVVTKGQQVWLRSDANSFYSVESWLPAERFRDQHAKENSMVVDTLTKVMLLAVSEHGCRDSATVSIEVRPFVYLPNAFSPNGDGRNDYFRPVSSGAPIFITYFYIYNRWGQLVYSGQGPAVRNGWDGTFSGRPCDIGTYYYTIQIEAPQGEIIKQNGDVTLVR